MADTGPEIIDPHHHLWGPDFMGGMAGSYLLDDLRADTATVAGLAGTMFMECSAGYRPDGPDHLKPVGETEFVTAVAEASDATPGPPILGIVAHADLTLPEEVLDEVLDAHEQASGGRFRGIRDALASAPEGVALAIPGGAEAGRAANPSFRRGVAHLGQRGLTYDTWQYHTQLPELVELARAVPGTTIVCDHLSTPLGVGPWQGRQDEVFDAWRPGIAELARCENVVMKLGGLAMPDNGMFPITASGDPSRPDVDAFVSVQGRWYLHVLDCFGADRCMFESNYPVDKMCVDYPVIWEAFARLTEGFDAGERAAVFAGTARRVYRL